MTEPAPTGPPTSAAHPERNWAGNITYGAGRLHRPRTVPELQELVQRSRTVRAVGSRHSFNDIVSCDDALVTVAGLPSRVSVDVDARTVTLTAGVRYGELAEHLQARGLALPNTGSLPHISVAGACATGTHGSGVGNQVLASSVRSLDLVSGDGRLLTLGRGDEGFEGAVISLGALGIMTSLTLDVVPTYEVRQDVYHDLPFEVLDEHVDEVLAAGYSVSLFTDLRAPRFEQVWVKRRTSESPVADDTLFGAARSTRQHNPVPGMAPDSCTEQGTPGPWHERLPHFRLDFMPSNGTELQSEYLLPREHAAQAWRALEGLHERMAALLMVCEVRAVAADDLWLSPAYRRDVIAFHFTWHQDWPAVRTVLADLEAALEPFDARPHWGKLNAMAAHTVRSLQPRLADFRELLRAHDPAGTFRNDFVDTYVG